MVVAYGFGAGGGNEWRSSPSGDCALNGVMAAASGGGDITFDEIYFDGANSGIMAASGGPLLVPAGGAAVRSGLGAVIPTGVRVTVECTSVGGKTFATIQFIATEIT